MPAAFSAYGAVSRDEPQPFDKSRNHDGKATILHFVFLDRAFAHTDVNVLAERFVVVKQTQPGVISSVEMLLINGKSSRSRRAAVRLRVCGGVALGLELLPN